MRLRYLEADKHMYGYISATASFNINPSYPPTSLGLHFIGVPLHHFKCISLIPMPFRQIMSSRERISKAGCCHPYHSSLQWN
ncbi:hypothetical protein D3C73_618360 [compost metagenome]